MTDNQLNRLNMANTVMAEMDLNSGIWNTNTKISAVVAALKGIIAEICVVEGIQSDSPKGATKSEREAWSSAAEIAEHVCFGLKAYYDDIEDETSFAMVNYTIYSFMNGRRSVVKDKMQKVYNKASGIPILALADFNVTSQNIADLQVAINDFENSIPMYTVLRARRAAATKELPGLFKSLSKKFRSLDLRMGTLKHSQAAFYDAYRKSRAVINQGKTQQAVELHLKPSEFKAIFGKKFKLGYWFVVRNHGDFPVVLYLTDNPGELDVENEVTIDGNAELKLEIANDFHNIFGHWLMVFNPNQLDAVHVTIIKARSKSKSKAKEKKPVVKRPE